MSKNGKKLYYEQIAAYLHYYANKYQKRGFEHWELVNEAWIRTRNLRNMKFASSGIRWAMLHYMKEQWAEKQHKDKSIVSIEEESQFQGIFIKDIVIDSQNHNLVVENLDLVEKLLRKDKLNVKEQILIDKLYFKDWPKNKIAKLIECTPGNITHMLRRISQKFNPIAPKDEV